MQINEVKSLFDIMVSFSRMPIAVWLVKKLVIKFMPQDHPWWVSIRFLELFENHGVARNKIPRFFKNGLRMHDTQNFLKLVSKLDEVKLQSAIELGVRREWLDGFDQQIYPVLDFYKQLKGESLGRYVWQ